MPRLTIRRGLAATLAFAALAVPAGAQAACHHTQVMPSAAHQAQARQATLCLLNAARRHHGLHALRPSMRLRKASERHSVSMVKAHYFEHGDFMGRITKTGYLTNVRAWTVGENLAWGDGTIATPAAIVQMWMHSPGHRANILSHSYTEIGVGIAWGTPSGGSHDTGGTYTTDFGRRG